MFDCALASERAPFRFVRITPGAPLAHTGAVKRDFLPAGSSSGAAGPVAGPPIGGRRRWLLWSALVGLLVIGQSLLVVLTLRYEDSRAMDRAGRRCGHGGAGRVPA
ncbi:MAG: hypothetical protein EBV28_07725 [Betaproteobacteria bacterium]|nr:hypothetical protein [Betaproteobacteria bacterium]